MKRKIRVERNTLRFSAAHFATFGDGCEPLHGHNYDVLVEVEGELTRDGWVLDFVELKGMVGDLCRQVDHRFLLPVGNRHLAVTQDGSGYEIAVADRRYVIPRADVVCLPIDNSTAERLAEWFAANLASDLRRRGATNVSTITVAVEEAPGQAGWCTLPLNARPARSTRRRKTR